MTRMVRQSTITCPKCGHRETETMPTDACQWFYDCKGCGEVLRPKPGDCCVFCSYGTVACPPIQEANIKPRAAGGRRNRCPCEEIPHDPDTAPASRKTAP